MKRPGSLQEETEAGRQGGHLENAGLMAAGGKKARVAAAAGQEAESAALARSDVACSEAMDVDEDASQSPSTTFFKGCVSLHEAVDRLAAERHPQRAACEDESGSVWTYAELRSASLRAAQKLHAEAKDAGEGAAVAVLMQRSNAWLAVCLACMRLGLPILGLSGDLKSPEETQRNKEALLEHRPVLLVHDRSLELTAKNVLEDVCCQGCPAKQVSSEILLEKHETEVNSGREVLQICSKRSRDDVLYLIYTGGTTSASKCVAITHEMALHELPTYLEFAPLRCTDRVLHQSSVFWGATSFGIFNVAWACGACLVFSEAGSGPAEVAAVVQRAGITVAGLVPSVLEALEPIKIPSLRLIFTWGEALAPHTAIRWAQHARVFDLLIASEYWLVLFAEYSRGVSKRPGFRPVSAAQLRLLPPAGAEGDQDPPMQLPQKPCEPGEVGELYIAGPMVTSVGYTQAAKNDQTFVDLPGPTPGSSVRHYRTRDLMRWMSDGTLEYCGRADGFAKVGGKWLDLASVEKRLVEAGCQEAVLLWDEQAKRRHAAVVLQAPPLQPLSERFASLQRLLPRDTHLHVLPELPRNSATGKVHRSRLVKQVALASQVLPTPGTERSTAFLRVQRTLVAGLVLAARAGVRGAMLASFLWRLAPGLADAGCLSELPESLADSIRNWVAWHRAFGRELSAEALQTLPWVLLLLIDAEKTGLQPFRELVEGPLGLLGGAILLSCRASPLSKLLLRRAGQAHAEKRWCRPLAAAPGERTENRLPYSSRCHAGWPWMFWTALPIFAQRWVDSRYEYNRKGYNSRITWLLNDAERAILELKALLRLRRGDSAVALALQPCKYCSQWFAQCSDWKGSLYCDGCMQRWEDYQKRKAERMLPEDGGAGEACDDSAAGDSTKGESTDAAVGESTVASDSLPVASAGSAAGSDGDRYFEPWVPGVDQVEFTEAEVQRAQSCIPVAGSAPVALNGAAATPVGRVVEKVTGLPGADPTISLDSLESLKIISLVTNLRRELGVDLAVSDVVRCACLGELEELCGRTASQAPLNGSAGAACPQVSNGAELRADDPMATGYEQSWPIYAIPRFWYAPVGWLIQLDEVPDEEAMRIACCALVRRHAALRARPYESAADKDLALVCNSMSSIVQVLWRFLLGHPAEKFVRQIGEACLAVWPRVQMREPLEEGDVPGEWDLAHFMQMSFSSESELHKAAQLRARSRGFKTPASIAVLVLEKQAPQQPPSATEREAAGESAAAQLMRLYARAGQKTSAASEKKAATAYLHVAVNHAASDGASIVPVVTDLLSLHREARALLRTPQQLPADMCARAAVVLERAALPPVPNGLAVGQARLDAALTQPCHGKATTDAQDLCHCVFPPFRSGYDHYVRLQPTGSRVFEAAARVVGIPLDHLWVVAIGVAYAKTVAARKPAPQDKYSPTGFGAPLDEDTVKLSLIVPCRDGKGEGQTVGNLANTRHLVVGNLRSRSLFSVCLEISQRLRRRDWEFTDVIGDDGDRVFINVRAIPKFEGAQPLIEVTNTMRSNTRNCRSVMEMFVDQESSEVWALTIGLRSDLDGSVFGAALGATVFAAATEPLAPAIPTRV
eukprot:TRINITY_DN35597_c0_g1_i1.p1 TRINITY_DN35597_c0_g1~~TRINITY_DN35597_c0_g1_i1.p1  ORF type:complete len:1591 (-),score=345.61 TRINITY_DN35597_c0_g1_i1:266-5038(-)